MQTANEILNGLFETQDYGYAERKSRIDFLVEIVKSVHKNENFFIKLGDILETDDGKIKWEKE